MKKYLVARVDSNLTTDNGNFGFISEESRIVRLLLRGKR